MDELTSRRRVVLVLGTSTGGVGQHVHSLAAGLVGAGDDVLVAGPAATQALFDFTAVGARFAPVEVSTVPRPGADARAMSRLRRLARHADVAHAHGLRAGFLAVGAVRSRRGARPALVVTWHNAVLGTGARRLLLTVLERVVARGADVSLGASADLVARARALGARDARPGPVAAPPLRAATRDRTEVRADLGVGDAPVVLAVGRLAPQKDYSLLLDAAGRWRSRDPRPAVLIAGDGPLRDDLQRRIDVEDLPVRLLGRRADVADLLDAADVVVLTSRWEARALVAQEALRAGVPLVATAVGGVPELVGDAAALVAPGDPDALAGAVGALLDDPQERARRAAAGRAVAATWPDQDETVRQVRAVHTAAAGRSGQRSRRPRG